MGWQRVDRPVRTDDRRYRGAFPGFPPLLGFGGENFALSFFTTETKGQSLPA
jgi:hypothetical protein